MRCSDVPADISRAAAAVSTRASRSRFDGGGDRSRELLEQAAHRCGSVARSPGEPADFLGDLAEAASDVAGFARGFDGGVERQQVGFAGDVLDQREHAEDLLGAALQIGGAFGDGGDPFAQPLDAGDCAADGGGAFVAGRFTEPGELRLRGRAELRPGARDGHAGLRE